MTLQRFEPFRELMNIQDRMNRLFADLGVNPNADGGLATAAWSPMVDIYETPTEIVVKAELPDMKQEDIHLSIENDRLTLRGERKFDSEVNRENYHRIERSYGTFGRTFGLPPTVQAERIRADYRNGILTVTLPKREVAQSKQINIEIK